MKRNEIINTLIKVARVAHELTSNAEEGTADGVVLVDSLDYTNLCEALEALESLPDIPNVAATGPAKAEHYLK